MLMPTLRSVCLVACGGALGSVARFALLEWLKPYSSVYPYATLVANLFGCFCIGLCLPLFISETSSYEDARFFLMIGLLGGFTTFSSFGLDTLLLLRQGAIALACINACLQLCGGVLLAFLGMYLGRYLQGLLFAGSHISS